jgi:hypothetical protein
MTRRQLEQKRDGLEAQMHWAALHDADQELLDLLRIENDRLFRGRKMRSHVDHQPVST